MNISGCRLAIVGATGLVGSQILKQLEKSGDFPVKLGLFASQRSIGRKIEFANRNIAVKGLDEKSVEDFDVAIFAAGSVVSRECAPIFAESGCIVIDKSSAWRTDPDCPLVVPQINAHALADIPKGIIASPNCSTTGFVLALKPLIELFGVPEHVMVATYQSVTGAGKGGLDALLRQRKGDNYLGTFAVPIFDNVIPAIGDIDETSFYTEESKLMTESRKILEIDELSISATAVRVPVAIGHSEAVTIIWPSEIDLKAATEALSNAPTIELTDGTPTPLAAAGRDNVLVGRIRKTPDCRGILNLFLAFDNLRRGAATNAIDILKALPES